MNDEKVKSKFLDVKTVAYMFDLHPQTVYTWVRRKRIPHYKVGGVIRFNVDELVVWARKRRLKGW